MSAPERADAPVSRNPSSHFIDNFGGVVPMAAGLTGDNPPAKPKLLRFLARHYPFASVADLGCGRAGWLHAAKKIGVGDVHGYDIPELDLQQRGLAADEFTAVDLAKPQVLERRYDLCVSTEVSEHVPVEGIEHYFDTLTAAAPVVLFSGAVPYQGGLGHVNEHWVEYWHGFFRRRNFHCIDAFRDRFWHDGSIPYYYRQNLLLYVAESQLAHFEAQGWRACRSPKTLIHPDLYLKHIHAPPGRRLREGHSLLDDLRAFYGQVDDRVEAGENPGYGTDSFKPATRARGLLAYARRVLGG